MSRLSWPCILVLLVILLSGTGVQAASHVPRTPPHPPLLSVQPPTQIDGDSAPSQQLDLPPLRAVLVVGPIDGVGGPWTTRETANIELAAGELEAHGVAVHRFYPPQTDWQQIRAAAEGAQFFLYRGHGVYWDSMPTPRVGGLALGDTLVSPEELRRELQLAPNAVVMLYGCFTAGSSSIDPSPIPSQEAQRRVAQYSEPFVEIGAAGYYANWSGDAFPGYVRSLFQGRTLGEAYEAFYDFDPATAERYLHPADRRLVLWLDKDRVESGWQYNNAFVGRAELTLSDLFRPPGLEVTPAAITYIAGPGSPPGTFALRVNSTGSTPFHWAATVIPQAPWLEIQPGSGTNGQAATVVVSPAGLAPGTHHATVKFSADDPQLRDYEVSIPVTLLARERVYVAFLPLAIHSAQ